MTKLKSMLVTLAMLLCCFSASAEEVEIDGLWYNLIAKGGGMAELISSVDAKTYSGDIMIPEIVTYDNKSYTVTSIGEKAFYGCSKLSSVTIPNSVTSIGSKVFYECSRLKTIIIGNGVTRIGSEAFYECSALKSATIGSSVTSIGNGAFRNCSSLTSITIPNSITSIGNMAFYGCKKLTSLHISDIVAWCNIKFSNDYSNPLYYAKHLYINDKEITELVIPDGIASINDYAFYNCIGITSVTLPQSVKSIGNYAFYFSSNLSSINIPNGVTSIGNYAFYHCTSLASINISNTVATIGDYAFFDCSGLGSINIGNRVISIGISAFYNCNSLTSVNISDLAAWCNIKFSDYKSNPLFYAKHLYMNGKEITELVIPDGVTTIKDNAFSHCTNINSVSIPNSVTSIGEDVFSACNSISMLTFGNSIITVGNHAFQNCSSLTSVTIPNSITSIGIGAFFGCTSLTSVHISDIAAWCNIKFGDNPLYYAKHLYMNGKEVTELIIPDGVTSIGDRAFNGFSSLISVTIPNGVTRIGWNAFENCIGLTDVTIPNSVTSISRYAFSGCEAIENVYCFAEELPLADESVFEKSYPEYATLYVPAVSISKYKTKVPWKNFGKIVELESSSIEDIKSTPHNVVYSNGTMTVSGTDDGTMVEVYGISGAKLGEAKTTFNTATISIGQHADNVVIVKIGNKAIKVAL